MANNQLAWQQIQPNHQGSNQMQNIAGDTLSKAGTIFDRTAEYFQKENDRIQRDRALLAQERERTFNNLGKQLSDEAIQYATEATTDKNGVVSHQFNANKFNDYIANRSAELGYQSLSPEDQASIWSGMNINKNYEQGMKNNQYNEENRLNRQKMMFDREQALWDRQIDKEKINIEHAKLYNDNKSKSNNKFDNNYNYLATDLISSIVSGTPLDKEKFKELAVSLYNTAIDDFQKNKIQRLLNFTDLNSKQAKYLENIRNDENSFNKTIEYLSKELNIPLEDIKKISTLNSVSEENTKNKDKNKFITDLTNGVFYNNVIKNLNNEKGGIKNDSLILNNEVTSTSFKKLINILGEYFYDSKKENTEKYITDLITNNMHNSWRPFISNKYSFKGSIEDVISALETGNIDSEVLRFLNISKEEDLKKLSEIAQRQSGIKFNNNNNSTKNYFKNNKNNNNISELEKREEELRIRQEMLKIYGNYNQINNINNINNTPKQIYNIPSFEVLNK